MKDGFTSNKGDESLNGKGPITLRLSDGRKNRGELVEQSLVRRMKIFLVKEKEKGGK